MASRLLYLNKYAKENNRRVITMFTQIDHLAIAVRDLDKSIPLYTGSYQLECTAIETLEDLKTQIAFIPVGEVLLELLRPTEPASEIDKFIREKGEVFHHIAYRVEDLDASIRELKKAGLRLIMEPREGGKGARIAFLDPDCTGSILTELVERKNVITQEEGVSRGKKEEGINCKARPRRA